MTVTLIKILESYVTVEGYTVVIQSIRENHPDNGDISFSTLGGSTFVVPFDAYQRVMDGAIGNTEDVEARELEEEDANE